MSKSPLKSHGGLSSRPQAGASAAAARPAEVLDEAAVRADLGQIMFSAQRLVAAFSPPGRLSEPGVLGIDWALLYVLKEHGPQKVSRAAGRIGASVETARASVRRLTSRGLVEQEEPEPEGKGRTLRIATAGTALLETTSDELYTQFVALNEPASRIVGTKSFMRRFGAAAAIKPEKKALTEVSESSKDVE